MFFYCEDHSLYIIKAVFSGRTLHLLGSKSKEKRERRKIGRSENLKRRGTPSSDYPEPCVSRTLRIQKTAYKGP